MNVNLILKFHIYDRNMSANELKRIVEFNETTCISKYKEDNYNVNVNLMAIEYIYNNVPLDRMNDLYSDIQKFNGKVSIIINELSSHK